MLNDRLGTKCKLMNQGLFSDYSFKIFDVEFSLRGMPFIHQRYYNIAICHTYWDDTVNIGLPKVILHTLFGQIIKEIAVLFYTNNSMLVVR